MTVEEYEKKFTELSRVAPFVVEDEANKCHKFLQRLNTRIKTYVVAIDYKDYGRLVEAALRVERSVQVERAQQQKRGQSQRWQIGGPSKTPKTGGRSGGFSGRQQSQGATSSQGSVRQPSGSQGRGSNQSRVPRCATCGRFHQGECHFGRTMCYYCGQEGHLKRDCP